MTSKTDARIRAAYEPVGALGEPLDRLIAKWRASRAHTYASENADLYRGFDNGCQRCADDLEAALRAAGDARRPQLHQKAIDRLTALHRHMGNVRSLLDRVQATRTPDHDAQDRTVGDWQEQVTLAIGELTEAAGAPADGAGPQEKEMQFRKKPVVIEAKQFFDDKPLPFRNHGVVMFDGDEGRFYIQTLEGALTVSNGDWVIRGVKGEFYPCKPDIFAATYEPAADGAGTAQRTGDEVI